MSLDIKYKCNICGDIYLANDIAIAYNKEIIKPTITKANGFVNGSIHICKKCLKVIRNYSDEKD